MKNYYEVLGVSPSSETEVITAAYKAMMRKYHPDANNSDKAAERAKEINEAYEILKNPVSRREYDEKMGRTQSRPSQSPPPPPPPPPTTNIQASEPKGDGENTPFVGAQGELRVWAIFGAAYIAIALLYFGPNKISASLSVRPLDLAAEVAGAAALPFALGFIIARIWRALSSSATEPKTDRMRWLAIQFVFIAILVFNKSMLEKARHEEAAATNAEAGLSEHSANCYSYSEQQKWADAATPCLQAAEGNDAKAQYILAKMYMAGNGVEESYEKSKSWYLKSADLGFPESQLVVGVAYSTGAITKDGKEDKVQAAIWVKKAAEQGLADAQVYLASMYESGEGVDKNINEALRWTELAAKQGNEDAMKRLSELRKANAKSAAISSWIGRYKGTLFGDAAATMHVTQEGEKLNFDLFMEGDYCGGGFEQTATPKNVDSIVVTMPYDADSGLQCKVQISQKSFGLELKELSACHMHHGIRCGFEGSLFKE
jgi:TPR repeat protein